MTDACSVRDMGKVKGSAVCRGDVVTVRKGDDDAGSHRGDVDAVFYIARTITGAAGVSNDKGRGQGCWDDVVAVKSINYLASLDYFT